MTISKKILDEIANRAEAGDGLAMDYSARMQRANEQGADFGWFHGTDSDIKAFDASKAGSSTLSESAKQGTWLTDDAPITANSYANYAATDAKVMAKTRQADEAADRDDWGEYDRLTEEAEQLDSKFYDDRKQGQNIMPLASMGKYKKMDAKGEAFNYAENDINKFIAQAKAEGFDGVDVANLDDAVGFVDTPANHRLVFEPKNIRSVNAAFDPAKKDSSNLLADVGSGVLLGGLAAKPTYNAIDDLFAGGELASNLVGSTLLSLGEESLSGLKALGTGDPYARVDLPDYPFPVSSQRGQEMQQALGNAIAPYAEDLNQFSNEWADEGAQYDPAIGAVRRTLFETPIVGDALGLIGGLGNTVSSSWDELTDYARQDRLRRGR